MMRRFIRLMVYGLALGLFTVTAYARTNAEATAAVQSALNELYSGQGWVAANAMDPTATVLCGKSGTSIMTHPSGSATSNSPVTLTRSVSITGTNPQLHLRVRAYSGGDWVLKVFVDGVQLDSNITVNSTTATDCYFSLAAYVNKGAVTLQLQNAAGGAKAWNWEAAYWDLIEIADNSRVTAESYVQRSLLAHWDAVDNQGTGSHVSTATTWKDRMNTARAFTLLGTSWQNGKALKFAGNLNSYGYLDASNSSDSAMPYTVATFGKVATKGVIEYAVNLTGSGPIVMQSTKNIAYHVYSAGSYGSVFRNTFTTTYNVGVSGNTTVAAVYGNSTLSGVYQNVASATQGKCGAKGSDNISGNTNGRGTVLGKRSTGNYFNGSIYALRLYSEQLSVEELAINYAIDRVRFYGATADINTLLPAGWDVGADHLLCHRIGNGSNLATTTWSDYNVQFDADATVNVTTLPAAGASVLTMSGKKATLLGNLKLVLPNEGAAGTYTLIRADDITCPADANITVVDPSRRFIVHNVTRTAGEISVELEVDASNVVKATWTGAANDGNTQNPKNWTCLNPNEETISAIPQAHTVVTIPNGCTNSFPVGGAFLAREVKLPATLGADNLDWSGIAAPFSGTLDLQGRKLTVSQLAGNGTITDSTDLEYELLDSITSDRSKTQYIKTSMTVADNVVYVLDFGKYIYSKGVSNLMLLGLDSGNCYGFGLCQQNKNHLTDNEEPWFLFPGPNNYSRYFLAWTEGHNYRLTVDAKDITTGNGSVTLADTTPGSSTTVTHASMTLLGTTEKLTSLGITGTGVTNRELALFGRNTGGSCSSFTFYRFWFKEASGTEHTFVPVRQISTGKCGILDLTTKTFRGNANTAADSGDFTPGAVTNYLLTAGAIGTPGELHINVAAGTTNANSTVALCGNMKLVKEGTGTFTAAKVGQTYFCGTEVAEGLLALPADNTAATGCLGSAAGAVRVAGGATLELNGNAGFKAYPLVLAGGTLRNGTVKSSNSADQLGTVGRVTLVADSTEAITNDLTHTGLIDLNERTLTVRLGGSGQHATLAESGTFTNGTVDIVSGGWFYNNGRALDMSTVNLKIGAAVMLGYDITVNNLELLYTANYGSGTGRFLIRGAYKAGNYHRNCVMQNGSTLDLGGQTGAWPLESTLAVCTPLAFADGATVTVKLGDRTVAVGDCLVSWTAANKPGATVMFRTDKTDVRVGFDLEVRDNGLYVVKSLPGNLMDVLCGVGNVMVDGEDWRVVFTNDMKGTIELPDCLGPVTIDLNGRNLVGVDGAVGDVTTAGGNGQPAIRIVASGEVGAATELILVNSGETGGTVTGGNGGAGNPPGNGGAGVQVAADVQSGVVVNVGTGVTVVGGVGGDDATGTVAGGRGGAGVIGDVGRNDGAIAGGAGGASANGTPGENGVANIAQEIAADELAAAKLAAKQAIDVALGENPSAAAQALADAAKQAIDAATSVAGVTTAKESGVADIAKQLAADELAAAKTAAKLAIDAALGENPSAAAQALADAAKQAIDAATTVADVTTAKEAGVADIAEQIAADELAAAKTAAKQAIDAALGENPSAAAQALADKAKQAIDAAETVADVTTAKEAGVADIAKQLAADELAAAKTAAKQAIDAALGANPSVAAQALADAAKQAIDAAETVVDVMTAKESGVTNIAKQIAADELAAAKEAAKQAIDAALGENPSAAAQALADAAKQAIDAAETVADITTAKETGVANIAKQIAVEELVAAKEAAKQVIDAALGENPSTAAQALADAAKQAIDAAETVADITTAKEAGVADIAKQLAADELAAAKEAAKQAIDAALGENPSEAAQALADAAKQAIDAATTVADVTTAKEAGVADIAKQIAADELAAAKEAAKQAIDAALGENPSAAAQALADAAKQAIDAAETVADVTTAKESGVANVAEQRRAEKLGLVTLEETDLVVDEGSNIIVRIKGGNSDWVSGVQVVVAYNTAAAADLDLKNATTNGVAVKSFKFPVTLNWAKGEIGEKTIEIPVAVDKTVEADETFTLQLANPMNATIAGAESGAQGLNALPAGDGGHAGRVTLPGLCKVTIRDPQYEAIKAKVASGEATKTETNALVKADKVFDGKVDVRGVANEATRGKVTGSALAAIGKTVTLKATSNKGWVFAGWYEGSAADGHAGRVTLPVSRETSLKVVASNAVTYVAQFIAPEEDSLKLDEFLPAEFTVGESVSITVRVESVSLPTVTVSGLPAGLKYAAKDVVDSRTKQVTVRANTIYGTPTKATAKPAVVTVTVKNLGGYVITRKYEVTAVPWTVSSSQPAAVVSDAAPYHAVSVEVNDDFAGKVTGAGVVQAGKKVTLKATANKGYVFSGWYDGNDTADGHAGRVTLPVSQAASYGFVMPSNEVALVARFVTVAEDAASIATGLNGLALDGAALATNVMAGVSLAWPVAAEALSLPTVKVTGLPAGLKFTAKDVVDSKTKQVAVPANTIYGAPTAASKPDRYGIVSPSQVKITVTTAGKAKRDYYLALTVDAMPAWAVGTFNGSAFAADGETPNGLATLTIAATGKVSGKLLADGLTWSLAAPYFTDYAPDAGFLAPLIGTSGKLAFTNELAVAADTLGGLARGERFAAAQNNWKVEPWKSRAATFGKVPAVTVNVGGDQTVTLKFAASGAVTAAGEFVTGVDAKGNKVVVKATCSTVVTPEEDGDAFNASVYVYFPPKGAFAGYSKCIHLKWNGTAFAVEP